MEKIKWDDQYCVNLLDVDENLKKIVDLINQIVELKSAKKTTDDEILETFADLTEFVRVYFPNEESYLTRYNYPELAQHKKEHKKFVKKLNAFRRWFVEDPNNLSEDVVNYLTGWIKLHIFEFDMKFGPFIRVQMYLRDCKKTGKSRMVS